MKRARVRYVHFLGGGPAGAALVCWNITPSTVGMKITIGSRKGFTVRKLLTRGVIPSYLKISASKPNVNIAAPCRLM